MCHDMKLLLRVSFFVANVAMLTILFCHGSWDNDSSLIHIGKETGDLHVSPIDRDAMDQYIFTFSICAYKFDNVSWAICNIAVFIVEDINDHFPEIDIQPNYIEFLESTYLTLDLQKFTVNDMDFGINATYNVSINRNSHTIYSAFDLLPNSGYQLATFRISVTNIGLLDFEDEEWRHFFIEVVSQELGTEIHFRKKKIEISLINWNDERPTFSKTVYVADVYENATKGMNISYVIATDRDIDDHVIHSIVGNAPGIQIDEDNGLIGLSEDNVFDYERQKTIILQIMAKDSLVTDYTNVINTVYTQLTININDINDETPVLIMPRIMANVIENSSDDIMVTSVEGRDPDTTAELMLEIIWEKSYATKGGQEAERVFYEGCLLMQNKQISQNIVHGHLKVNPQFLTNFEIDYEKYDTIFLTMRVTDLKQQLNVDFSEELLTVRIIDVNDNPPEFNAGTLTLKRKVVENEAFGTVIVAVPAVVDIQVTENKPFQLVDAPSTLATEALHKQNIIVAII